MVQITNGTIKYGRTVKTGDFESKRGDCELSFTIAEGEDANVAITKVEKLAIGHVFDILGVKEDGARAAHAEVSKDEKPAAAKATKPPKTEKAAVAVDASEVVDDTPAFLKSTVAAENTKASESVDDGDLGDLLGGTEPAKDITDKELTDATQKCQSANKNGPAIRKILKELGIVTPPGRIIDLPQADRQKYIDRLKEVKPLA